MTNDDQNAAYAEAIAKLAAASAPAALAPLAVVATGKTFFALSVPVTLNGETRNDISYRRPRGSDMRAYLNSRKGYGDDYQMLMVNLCELPDAFFDMMDGADFMALANQFKPFLDGVRKTSTT
jgi:Phage tail assembly chaperone proteins, E, or 41 or 14